MAYDIIDKLTEQKEQVTLNTLKNAVRPTERKRGKKHQVWKDTFDVKECRTEKFIMQKLSYIHNNPCTGKWKLADSSIHYPHSSASFYISGKAGNFPVKDYREYLKF